MPRLWGGSAYTVKNRQTHVRVKGQYYWHVSGANEDEIARHLWDWAQEHGPKNAYGNPAWSLAGRLHLPGKTIIVMETTAVTAGAATLPDYLEGQGLELETIKEEG